MKESVLCSRSSGRPNYDANSEAFERLCAYLAQNEDSQYSMTELVDYSKEMSTTDDTYSEKHLKRRLLHK